MDILKQQIQQQLVSNYIKDKLKNTKGIIFNESRCTVHRRLPFTTRLLRNIMMPVSTKGGEWEDGDFLMYEMHLAPEYAYATLSMDTMNIPEEYAEKRDRINTVFTPVKEGNVFAVKKWQFACYPEDIDGFFKEFDTFLNSTIRSFEHDSSGLLKEIHEGKKEIRSSTKYERNPVARKMCIDFYGTACRICGFDFGKAYGPLFAGKIEVHHRLPISEIGEDYVVDPIKDLVPVCPNCHTALHSKKDGVYTVEELIEMRKNI